MTPSTAVRRVCGAGVESAIFTRGQSSARLFVSGSKPCLPTQFCNSGNRVARAKPHIGLAVKGGTSDEKGGVV